MPIIKHGGPQKFSHLKQWASELPKLRTTELDMRLLNNRKKMFVKYWGSIKNGLEPYIQP